MQPDSPITRSLLIRLASSFALSPRSVHGPAHWMRVRQNGLRLASLTGANKCVVELFSVLHDSCRLNDYEDPQHGPRAAQFAEDLYLEGRIPCSRDEMLLLTTACEGHTASESHSDITVATCWDADRLDLFRVGITPDPRRLCTEAGRLQDNIFFAETKAKDWLWKIRQRERFSDVVDQEVRSLLGMANEAPRAAVFHELMFDDRHPS
jgi:uncharacterized protein